MPDISDTTISKTVRPDPAPAPALMVGAALRDRRRALGLTQRDVADLADVNRETIGRAERGDEGIALGTLLRIAEAVGMELIAVPRYPDP